MRKVISIIALCVFTISIWSGIALAKNDHNANGVKGKPVKISQVQRFKDVDRDWAREDIEEASYKGFIKGYQDGTFQPNKPVSRLETIVILIRVAGLEELVEDYQLSNKDYKELKKVPDWAKAYVAVALKEGIIFEDEIKTFNPNQGAKRYEVCIYMQNLLDKFNINPDDDRYLNRFKDKDIFPLKAHKSIKNLAWLGVVNGYPDGSFSPMRVVKRNEIARMINYLYNNCIGNKASYVLKGTLSEVELKQEVLKLKIADNKGKKWSFSIEEEDDIKLYYDDQKLKFDDWDQIEAGGAVSMLLNKNQEAVWIRIAAPEQKEDYLLCKGTLKKVDLDDEVIKLDIVDSKGKEWSFTVEEDDEADIYYGAEKLESDEWDLIEAGGDVKMLLDKEQELVWIKIAPPEQEADYLLFEGTLKKAELNNEVLNLNIVDSKGKKWAFALEEEDELDLYYGSQELAFDNWDQIEAGGSVRVLLDKDQEVIWLKIARPEQEEDYTLVTGTLSELVFDDEVVYLNIVYSNNKEWDFTIDQEDELDLYYDGKRLAFQDLESIKTGGEVKMLLNKDEKPIWIKMNTPS